MSRLFQSVRPIAGILLRARLLTAMLCLAAPAGAVLADEPLHWQIDALIGVGNPDWASRSAGRADDAEFLRRIYLDLVGTIPTSREVVQFLHDPDFDKRRRLIDRLLADPWHARRLQYVFDQMLMERRPDKHVPSKEWRGYLRHSFLDNKPWDRLVREVLSADGAEDKLRPAAKFVLDRKLDADLLTRDIGRVFLGRDLQCAQCHDHPSVDDYLQRHYFGIAAFFKRSSLFTDSKTKKVSIGEKAEGEVSFTSVFTDVKQQTAPRILDLPPIPDPPKSEQPYLAKPAKNVRSVPAYSRRLQLADAITDPSNTAFRRNIANRLWAFMMGRGLVEPLDMWHNENPPSHPILLDRLADDLMASGYNIRRLLRELALTETYQRSSQGAEGIEGAGEAGFAVAALKPLSAEQLAWSMMQALGVVETKLPKLKAKLASSDPKTGPKRSQDSLWQEEALNSALAVHVDLFVTTFSVHGAQSNQFDPSAGQALFLLNGKVLQGWLRPQGENLTGRLNQIDNPRKTAAELFRSVLSRLPTQQEVRDVVSYLEDRKQDQPAALQELAWVLLSSAEFRFNH